MIVAEKCAGTPQGHGKIIGIHRLPKIPRTHCRGIRRSKHPKHKSRAVHHGHDHIHTHRIHRRLHDVLHIGHLQRLNRRGRKATLILGVLTRLGALGIGAIMVGAIAMVHAPNGFFMNWMGNQKGEGFEYHLIAIALAVVLLALGGGAASIDRLLARRRPAEGGGIDNRFAMG